MGGGVSKKAEKFLPHIQIRTPLVAAELQNEAGIIGAAVHASSSTHPHTLIEDVRAPPRHRASRPSARARPPSRRRRPTRDPERRQS